MSRWQNAALAVALTMAVTASPVLAKQRNTAAQDWRNARAQAIPNSDITLSGDRAGAIHQCSTEMAKLPDYLWGGQAELKYRSCMAQHGHTE